MATIFEDDFNSYDNGDLSGQGDWIADVDFDIQGDVVKEGAKAVRNSQTSGDTTINKVGTPQTDGKITFYVRVASHATWGEDKYFTVAIHSGNTWITHPSISVKFSVDGKIYASGDAVVELQAFSDDQWYQIEIEWRSSPDYKFRVQIDDGGWSEWAAGYGGNWTDGLKSFGANWFRTSGGPVYLDHIAEKYIFTEKSVTDSGVGADVLAIKNSLLVPDSGVGVDIGGKSKDVLIQDVGVGVDILWLPPFRNKSIKAPTSFTKQPKPKTTF